MSTTLKLKTVLVRIFSNLVSGLVCCSSIHQFDWSFIRYSFQLICNYKILSYVSILQQREEAATLQWCFFNRYILHLDFTILFFLISRNTSIFSVSLSWIKLREKPNIHLKGELDNWKIQENLKICRNVAHVTQILK